MEKKTYTQTHANAQKKIVKENKKKISFPQLPFNIKILFHLMNNLNILPTAEC